MTGRNQGAVCSREPRVPPPVARLASLVTKAELVELLWFSLGIASPMTGATPFDRLVALVRVINLRRREADPMRRTLDASKLNGAGVAELREACGTAARLELEQAQEPEGAN